MTRITRRRRRLIPDPFDLSGSEITIEAVMSDLDAGWATSTTAPRPPDSQQTPRPSRESPA